MRVEGLDNEAIMNLHVRDWIDAFSRPEMLPDVEKSNVDLFRRRLQNKISHMVTDLETDYRPELDPYRLYVKWSLSGSCDLNYYSVELGDRAKLFLIRNAVRENLGFVCDDRSRKRTETTKYINGSRVVHAITYSDAINNSRGMALLNSRGRF